MNNTTRLSIFKAQVQNVRSLRAARKQIGRAVNTALRTGDDHMATVQTKTLALVFCAWAEANFSKLIHTPHGFTLGEIENIKREWASKGIAKGWEKCVENGLHRVPAKNSGFVPNARQCLNRIIKDFVHDPSLLRNKIAHGQWSVALNKSDSAVNAQITQLLKGLDSVQVEIWFESHGHLALIVESLIESPERTFLRDYWPQLTDLETFVKKSKNWSLAEKITRLKVKTDWYAGLH